MKNNTNVEKLTFSVAEAAGVIGISVPTAYKLIHQADFPALHIGTRWVIPKEALREWLDREGKRKREIN